MLSRFHPESRGSVVGVAVLCGIAAGLVAALFLTVTAEPSIAQAIKIEESRLGPGAVPAHQVVSRDVQKGVGLFAAYALAGAGFGLLLAAGFVAARKHQPDLFRAACLAGAVLAGTLTVSPWLKYPPNPPAVGDPATLSRRQFLYVTVLVVTLLVLAGATYLSGRLRSIGWNDARRTAAVVAAIVVSMGLVYALLPPPPDPVNVPATLLWRFRLASLGGNLTLWSVLTLAFGVVATRSHRLVAPAAAPT